MKMKTSKFIAQAAVIATLYAGLTLALAPISYGVVQFRLSEALTVLSLFTPAAVPGLTIGCFLANIIGPNGIMDAVIGSAATLIGCWGMWKCRKYPYPAIMINVIANAVIIGWMLWHFYFDGTPLLACMGSVGLGELVSCYVPGFPLIKLVQRYGKSIGFNN